MDAAVSNFEVPRSMLKALREHLLKLDVANYDAICTDEVSPSCLSNFQVPTCLPGVILAYAKGNPSEEELQYPNLAQVSEGFRAVTANMFKKADARYHPLLELGILINQLFGMTYFTDLTMVGHLVAISFGVSLKEVVNADHAQLRHMLSQIEHLRDIFFSKSFNYFCFEQPANFNGNMIPLDRAITMLQDNVMVVQGNEAESDSVSEERMANYNAIRRLLKHRTSVCIVMQIRYCKGSLSAVPTEPADVEELIALNYQVVKV
jgi:hypothetical protein